ncbi:MAG: MBL fold metallo-hydrolase [Tannerellaceae bacterium]|jgi:L-ascorbate metabolism protein UlaG (beta-lactamase superfamily)|nr:MBL fold metallo-hydrolase [Tannerellaceae bacterium]
MKLTYIYHSCYTIETDKFSVIFDYYKDSGNTPYKGYIHEELLRKKSPLYVLASHHHPDHFNKHILDWKKEKKEIIYILSSDILTEKKANSEAGVFLKKNDIWKDENITIKAFGSTDAGISFLIRMDEKTIFHAGDLNNWHWKDESTAEEAEIAEKSFLLEVNDIAKFTNDITITMFPIDPRLGNDYMLGAEQLISKIKVGTIAPMHFGEAYDKANNFASIAEKNNCKFLSLSHKGECFTI